MRVLVIKDDQPKAPGVITELLEDDAEMVHVKNDEGEYDVIRLSDRIIKGPHMARSLEIRDITPPSAQRKLIRDYYISDPDKYANQRLRIRRNGQVVLESLPIVNKPNPRIHKRPPKADGESPEWRAWNPAGAARYDKRKQARAAVNEELAKAKELTKRFIAELESKKEGRSNGND